MLNAQKSNLNMWQRLNVLPSDRSGRSNKCRASKPKALKAVKVKNQSNLVRHAAKRGSVRVGSTCNVSGRKSQYKSNGYKGKMYVAKTTNMKKAENKLLAKHSGRHNVHQKSNAAAKPGYVYVIKGRKSK